MFSATAQISVTEAVSAAVALIALLVSMWQFLSNRPKIRLNVSPNIVLIGGSHVGSVRYVRFTVTNVGVQPTWLHSVGVEGYDCWIDFLFRRPKSLGVVNAGGPGLADVLPKKLAPGDSAMVLALQNDRNINEFWSSRYVAALAHHSWSDRPIRKLMGAEVMREIRTGGRNSTEMGS